MRISNIGASVLVMASFAVACSEIDGSVPPVGVANPHAIVDDGFPYPADNNSCQMPEAPVGRMCDAIVNVNHIAWVRVVDMQWKSEPIALLAHDGQAKEWVAESDCEAKGGSVEPTWHLTFETLSASRSVVEGPFTFEMGSSLYVALSPRPMVGQVPGTTEWLGESEGTKGTLSIGEEVGVFARVDPETRAAELVNFYSFDDDGHLVWPTNACTIYEDGPPSVLTRDSFDSYVSGCAPFREESFDNWGEGYPVSQHHPTCVGASVD